MHPQIQPEIIKNIFIYFLWKNVQLCSCTTFSWDKFKKNVFKVGHTAIVIDNERGYSKAKISNILN